MNTSKYIPTQTFNSKLNPPFYKPNSFCITYHYQIDNSVIKIDDDLIYIPTRPKYSPIFDTTKENKLRSSL